MEKLSEHDAVMWDRVYVPAFVKRCSAHGINIPDKESLHEALETTALVLSHAQEKQGDVIKSANASLKRALGVEKKEAALNEHQDRLKHAFELGRDPEIRNAILGAVIGKAS